MAIIYTMDKQTKNYFVHHEPMILIEMHIFNS